MREPPGPTHDVFRRYFANRADFLDQARRDYGPIVYFRVGIFRIYLISEPADVKQLMTDRGVRKSWLTKLLLWPVIGKGLLVSEGDLYKRQRRLIQPAFHRKRVQTYGKVAVEASESWCSQLSEGPIEMEGEMMGLTLDVVGRSLFGSSMGPEAQRIARSLDSFYDLFDWAIALGPLALILPHPKSLRFLWHLFRLRRFVDNLIEERRCQEPQDDLLSMLIQAQEDGQGMSPSQIRSEALTLLLAGHETTAVSLTWTWYLLSQNPHCEAQLHDEIDRVLEGRPPTIEDLPKLEYTRRVLSESMRLYPPAYLIDRNPSQDLEIRGYTVPKGSFAFVSPYVSHRNEKYFPEPTKFDPDRWLPECVESRPQYSYFPFGVGPRACIGQSFAWMEAILGLATVARQWRFRLDPGQRIDTNPKITLRPRYGMKMHAHRR